MVMKYSLLKLTEDSETPIADITTSTPLQVGELIKLADSDVTYYVNYVGREMTRDGEILYASVEELNSENLINVENVYDNVSKAADKINTTLEGEALS